MASLPQTLSRTPATRPFKGPRKRVLIVDDEVAFAAVMKEVLDSFGLEVQVAYDAKDALLKLEENPPNLMLVDVMMPEVDGLSLIRRIQSEPAWLGIPIVVISARARGSDKTETKFAGGGRYTWKTMHPTKVCPGRLPSAPPAGIQVGPPTVLVVDDDPTFCGIMAEILKMYRARVFIANSAEEAIAILA